MNGRRYVFGQHMSDTLERDAIDAGYVTPAAGWSRRKIANIMGLQRCVRRKWRNSDGLFFETSSRPWWGPPWSGQATV
jgi:hypothetical protein